jgi:hypothetical protein
MAADPVANPGKTRRDQFALGEKLLAVAYRIGVGDQAPVAVGREFRAPQHDGVAADQRVERCLGSGAARRRGAVLRRRQRRHLDRR